MMCACVTFGELEMICKGWMRFIIYHPHRGTDSTRLHIQGISIPQHIHIHTKKPIYSPTPWAGVASNCEQRVW